MNATQKPPPAADRSPSGEHPAVKVYRKKLASIAEQQIGDNDALDADLADYLAAVKTPKPPPPDPIPDEPATTPKP